MIDIRWFDQSAYKFDYHIKVLWLAISNYVNDGFRLMLLTNKLVQFFKIFDSAQSAQNLQSHLEAEVTRLGAEFESQKAKMASQSDELETHKLKNILLQKELENLQEKYKSDLKINQSQINNLLAEVEEGKKKNAAEIHRISQSTAKDIKIMQV